MAPQTPDLPRFHEDAEDRSSRRWAIPATLAIGVLALTGFRPDSPAAAPMELRAAEAPDITATAQGVTTSATSLSAPNIILFTVDDMGE